MRRSDQELHKGRGALTNREGRFERTQSEVFDDGWGTLDVEPYVAPQTHVHPDALRSLITRNQSPDIPFDQSINPYRGCEHGCIYCYARPSHTYLGLSAGLDFETRLFAKQGAGAVLDAELRKPRYQVKTIMLGSNTDIYQPIERQYRVTREILETLWAFRHPVCLITKSALILRDLDLLSQMAAANLVRVTITVTTLSNDLARRLEPRAAAPHRRIEVIQALAEAGVPVSVNAAPMIPALNDMELEKILETGKQAGAQGAMYILLRLPNEVRDLFVEWLQAHYPNKLNHVMNLLRETRDGADYEATWGVRFRGRGIYADLLSQRFRKACTRLGLNLDRSELDMTAFRPPPRPGDQLKLF